MNNYIVSTYLTSGIDHQRGKKQQKNDVSYIQKWAESIAHLGLQAVVLHDGLSTIFMSQFQHVWFIKVDKVPDGLQLYDYRWVLYLEFMMNNSCDGVFFTDISDVVVKRNPFYEMQPERLYCGDEPTSIRDCVWLQKASKCPVLSKLADFRYFLSSNDTLLNAGILGGSNRIVFSFLLDMNLAIEKVRRRPIDGTVDMPIFNYVIQRYSPVHGFPVNSVFKKYEERNDVWFIHK